eukprot:1498354-Pyramimonas_sp.AAC.1
MPATQTASNPPRARALQLPSAAEPAMAAATDSVRWITLGRRASHVELGARCERQRAHAPKTPTKVNALSPPPWPRQGPAVDCPWG